MLHMCCFLQAVHPSEYCIKFVKLPVDNERRQCLGQGAGWRERAASGRLQKAQRAADVLSKSSGSKLGIGDATCSAHNNTCMVALGGQAPTFCFELHPRQLMLPQPARLAKRRITPCCIRLLKLQSVPKELKCKNDRCRDRTCDPSRSSALGELCKANALTTGPIDRSYWICLGQNLIKYISPLQLEVLQHNKQEPSCRS